MKRIAALKAMGHVIVVPLGQTSRQFDRRDPARTAGRPDPRTRGAEAAGQ